MTERGVTNLWSIISYWGMRHSTKLGLNPPPSLLTKNPVIFISNYCFKHIDFKWMKYFLYYSFKLQEYNVLDHDVYHVLFLLPPSTGEIRLGGFRIFGIIRIIYFGVVFDLVFQTFPASFYSKINVYHLIMIWLTTT